MGEAAGTTALYAVSLILFMVCGVWMPYRNFTLIRQRIGQGGEMPGGSANAMNLNELLYNWQGLLIIVFIGLLVFFWWTSTWKDSMSRKSTRFLLWCVPIGLYVLMFWIIRWLFVPLSLVGTRHP